MNKTILFPVLFVVLMLAVFAEPANAADLDENMCVNTINGNWLSSTCFVNASYNLSVVETINITSGIALKIFGILGNFGTININDGGTFSNVGTIINNIGGTVFIACGGTFINTGAIDGFITFEICKDPKPVTDIQNLIDTVENLNLQHGIEKSLVAKLNAAMQEIQNNNNNNAEAIDSLQAFINEVNAQRWKKISEAEADRLIAAARAIISNLTGLATPKKRSVLIINDDNDIYFNDDQSVPIFMSGFKGLGYDIKFEKASETDPSTWKNNDILVWSCGDDYSPINDKSKQNLIDYVDKGGHLLLEGGNIAAMIKEFGEETLLNRLFREKVLHATRDWVYHDVGDLKLKNDQPIATTPNKLPKTIGFTPTEPGDQSGDADAVRILPDATGIYGWSSVAYDNILLNDSIVSNLYGLMAYANKENGGRIIYIAFDIDDIESPEIQQILVLNSENWLGSYGWSGEGQQFQISD